MAECLVKYEIEAPNVRVGGLTAPIPDYIQLDGINHECLSYKQTRWVTFERTAGWNVGGASNLSYIIYIIHVILVILYMQLCVKFYALFQYSW